MGQAKRRSPTTPGVVTYSLPDRIARRLMVMHAVAHGAEQVAIAAAHAAQQAKGAYDAAVQMHLSDAHGVEAGPSVDVFHDVGKGLLRVGPAASPPAPPPVPDAPTEPPPAEDQP